MKKSFLLSKICGFAAVFAVILTLAACANNAPSKADVSLTIPKEVIQTIADEAAREGEVTADTLCNITCLLYVDGWAEAFNEWNAYDRVEETDASGNKTVKLVNLHNDYENHYLIEKNVPLSKINDVVLTHPEVYIGAKVQADVIVSCGKVSYSGRSVEVELTEAGATLEVTLKKDKRKINITNTEILPVEEYKLTDPTEGVDKYGNEYWDFKVPAQAQDYSINWFVDSERQNSTASTLRLYKALISKGPHSVSYAGTNGNKKCTGDYLVYVNKRDSEEDRIVFISTDKGLEFVINRFESDVRFNDFNIRDRGTDIQINCEMNRDEINNCKTWHGIWPFVEPGNVYTFDVSGHWGDPSDPNHATPDDDHWKQKTVTVQYTGDRNAPVSKKDWEYISIINNYVNTKQYTVKEVNIAAEGKPLDIRYISTFIPTEENEIFKLFAESNTVSGIIAEWQVLYYKKNNPDDPTDPWTHEEWITSPRQWMYETGDRQTKFVDFDILEEEEWRREDLKNRWDAIQNDIALTNSDVYLRMEFFYRLQGMGDQTFRIRGYQEDSYVRVPRYNESN